MDAVIVTAIKSRHELEFIYDGEARVVEPYCYGTGDDNRWLLRAWQIYGMNPGWRLFHSDKMAGLRDNGRALQPARSGYTPNDSAMRSVYAHI